MESKVPFLLAGILAFGSLLVYLRGAVLTRLAAPGPLTRADFNLGRPRAPAANTLFAIGLVAATTPASTVVLFFPTAVGDFGPVLLLCPILFCGGNFMFLSLYERARERGYLYTDYDDELVGGLVPSFFTPP